MYEITVSRASARDINKKGIIFVILYGKQHGANSACQRSKQRIMHNNALKCYLPFEKRISKMVVFPRKQRMDYLLCTHPTWEKLFEKLFL